MKTRPAAEPMIAASREPARRPPVPDAVVHAQAEQASALIRVQPARPDSAAPGPSAPIQTTQLNDLAEQAASGALRPAVNGVHPLDDIASGHRAFD